jgi:hypothetical protein
MDQLMRAAAGQKVPVSDPKPDPPSTAGSFDGGRGRGATQREPEGMETLLREAAGVQPPSEGGST